MKDKSEYELTCCGDFFSKSIIVETWNLMEDN